GSAEPRQSCEPLSALICPEHDVSVLGSSFETALLKFKQHLIEGILGVGARLSQPFRDQGLRQQTLKPRDYPAVLDVHAQPPTATEISNAQFGLLSGEWALIWFYSHEDVAHPDRSDPLARQKVPAKCAGFSIY